MSKKLEMIAAVYQDEDRAKTILDMLERMNHAQSIELVDAATLTKNAEGKLNVVETREVSGGKGAKQGAIAGAVLGVIFPPSLIVSAVAGGAVGGLFGKLRDTGLKSKSMEELGQQLQPGQAAVVALVEPHYVEALEKALQGYDGQLIKHSFNATESAEIEAATTTTTSA